jgi:hypothetical protein
MPCVCAYSWTGHVPSEAHKHKPLYLRSDFNASVVFRVPKTDWNEKPTVTPVANLIYFNGVKVYYSTEFKVLRVQLYYAYNTP